MPTTSSGEPAPIVNARLTWVVLHALFFFSGAASLACEVVWFKQLGFVLGSSTFSASVVVSCFFGGLSLGSIAFGRVADRVSHPLVAYGAIELSLGVVSLGTTLLLSRWEDWIGALTPWMSLDAAGARPMKIALALLILLPPTVLMGATLPVLSRTLVRSRSELAARIGTLYALNTLGAAIGCAVVGWVTIGTFGLVASAGASCVLYVAIGVSGLGLAARTPAPPVASDRADSPAAGAVPALLVAVFSASGFLAIGYEVLWFRMLRYFAAHTVYTFSTFLSVYLLGLVLGSAISARWLSVNKAALSRNFATVQLWIGMAALLSFAVLGRSRNVLLLGGGYRALDPDGLTGLVALSTAVLLPPTVLLGLAFPLASELAVVSMARLGSRIGLLYGLNTLGGVLGSLVTGFVLLPWLGAQLSFEVLIVGNLLLFAILVASDPALRSDRAFLRSGALTALLVFGGMLVLGQGWLRAGQTAFTGEILDFRENEDATFLVMGYDEGAEGKYQQIIVNGTSYANNRPPFRRYMALLGHLPVLLHQNPKDAVVICIGTGTTVGAVSLYPELDPVYAVDLTRHMFDLATHFVPINNRFTDSPRVRPVVADGRHFLLVTDQHFDVMTFEPPPPQQAGVVNLYSREFYRLADARMASGGIIAQWIPLHQGYDELQRSLIRTMLDQFEHVSLWLPSGGEGIVIASHDPLTIDMERMAARMADPVIAKDLAAIGVDSVEELLALFVLADEALSAWVGDVPELTDDHPTIEYYFGYQNTPFRNAPLVSRREPVERWLSGPLADSTRLDLARQQSELYWRFEDADKDGDDALAADTLARALLLDPSDPFLRYQSRALQAGVVP